MLYADFQGPLPSEQSEEEKETASAESRCAIRGLLVSSTPQMIAVHHAIDIFGGCRWEVKHGDATHCYPLLTARPHQGRKHKVDVARWRIPAIRATAVQIIQRL